MKLKSIPLAVALVVSGAGAVVVPAAPALATWKLVKTGTPSAVAKSTLTVTAGEDWNRNTYRPIKKGEVWTLDGPAINELYFVAGLVAGETLYRDADKVNNPLPTMGAKLQLAEVPEFFESSVRIALKTSVFEMTQVEPTRMGGHDAVKFRYEYAVQGSSLKRKGVGSAALVDGKLYLIVFNAPALAFYDRDAAKVEAIMASATI